MKRILPIVLATLIVVLTLKAINEVKTDQSRLKLKEIKIQNINQELDKLQTDYQKLQLDKSKSEQEKEEQIKELQQKQEQLEKDLQAKRLLKDQQAKAYAESVKTTTPAQKPVTTPHNASGGKYDWMRQAGIPESEMAAAEKLVHRESSWNVNAYNSSSGSCSLVQALPCSKIPGNWRDPVTALRWGNSYVKSRYGTWQVALNHSLQYNWY